MFRKTKTKTNFDSDYTKFEAELNAMIEDPTKLESPKINEPNEKNLLTLRGNIEKDLADLMDGNYDKKIDKNIIEKLIRKFKALKSRVGNYKTEAAAFAKKKEAERLKAEQKAKEEAARLAAEQEEARRETEKKAQEQKEAARRERKKAEAERQKQQAEAERLAAEEKQAKNDLFGKFTDQIINNITQYATSKHTRGLFIFKHFRNRSRTKQQNLLTEGLKAIKGENFPLDEKVKIAKGLLLFVQGEIAAERVILNQSRLKVHIDAALKTINFDFKSEASEKECIDAFKRYAASNAKLNIFKGIPAKIDASQKKIGKKAGKK